MGNTLAVCSGTAIAAIAASGEGQAARNNAFKGILSIDAFIGIICFYAS
jgi:hypothetical protein